MKSKINGGKLEPEALFRRDASVRTAGAITKSAGGYAIADTSTTAQVGDIYRADTATTAAMLRKQYKVIEASTNSFTIASKDLPVLGDTFYVLGPVTPRHDNTGAISATIDTTGLATSAKQDTLLAELQLKADLTETQPVSMATIPVGAATSALQSSTSATLDASINTLLKPANTLAAVTLVSTVTTVGAVTAITNALPAGTNNIGDIDVLSLPAIPAGNNNIGDVDVASIAAGDNNIGNVDIVTLPALVAGSALIGKVGIDQTTPGTTNLVALAANQSVNVAQINGVTTLMGAGTDGTGSQRITSSSGATGTTAPVADSASSVTLLAASTSRLGACFFNDSTEILYLKFGATASTSSFAVKINPQDYYELPGPHIYNGIIDGIWANNASGNCLVTSW